MAPNMPEWLSKSRMNQINFGAVSFFKLSQMLNSGKLQCFKTVVGIVHHCYIECLLDQKSCMNTGRNFVTDS
ncbi:MAG: hypothetical protein MHMPM18_002360 [Marteilia pararefringens]